MQFKFHFVPLFLGLYGSHNRGTEMEVWNVLNENKDIGAVMEAWGIRVTLNLIATTQDYKTMQLHKLPILLSHFVPFLSNIF